MSKAMKDVSAVIFVLSICFGVSQADPFKCHGDWCNVDNEPQFCSEAFQYCRNCKDIKEACGTAEQPRNCTAYCQELAVEIALKEKRKEFEGFCLVLPMLLNLPNGKVIVPPYNGSRIPTGSEIKYKCNNGYRLEGVDTNTCLGNDTWVHTTFSYCSEISWIGYAAIMTGSVVLLLVFVIGLFAIKHCRSLKKISDKEVSRTSTDSSFNNEQGFLLAEEGVHNEDETSPLTMGSPFKLKCDYGRSVSTQTPALPTAPPLVGKNDNEQTEAREGNRSCYESTGVQHHIIINNNNNLLLSNINNTSQQKDYNNKSKSAEANKSNSNDPRSNDVKSIEEKFATEESNDKNELGRGTNSNVYDGNCMTGERPRDIKRKGTEHLPARDVDKKPEDIGPQVVAAKDGQSPTKETEREDGSARIGIKSVTFSKSDIKKQGQHIKAERDESLESATKESGQDILSAKFGFSKLTFPKSDIKIKELKECS